MEEVRARRKCAVVHKPCRALVAMERSSHYPKGNIKPLENLKQEGSHFF